MGACDDVCGVSGLDAAVASHVFDALAEEGEVRGVGRIEDLDEGHRDVIFGGEGADFLAISEEDGDDGFEGDESGGGAEDA